MNSDYDKIWERLLNQYLDKTFDEKRQRDLEKELDHADFKRKQEKEEALLRSLD